MLPCAQTTPRSQIDGTLRGAKRTRPSLVGGTPRGARTTRPSLVGATPRGARTTRPSLAGATQQVGPTTRPSQAATHPSDSLETRSPATCSLAIDCLAAPRQACWCSAVPDPQAPVNSTPAETSAPRAKCPPSNSTTTRPHAAPATAAPLDSPLPSAAPLDATHPSPPHSAPRHRPPTPPSTPAHASTPQKTHRDLPGPAHPVEQTQYAGPFASRDPPHETAAPARPACRQRPQAPPRRRHEARLAVLLSRETTAPRCRFATCCLGGQRCGPGRRHGAATASPWPCRAASTRPS